jgi:uncharacterized SAM-binding protein YcdF (DUF218 family)
LPCPPPAFCGDACARTTWENTTRTSAWLQQHHPGAPVLLITDPWQLPRASRAFQRQGLSVIPLAAEPSLAAAARNRLALREAAGTLLYGLQGRLKVGHKAAGAARQPRCSPPTWPIWRPR